MKTAHVMNNKWSDYWRDDSTAGEVFVNQEGGKPVYIDEFWKRHFSSVLAGDSILDIACGAGSVFASINSDVRKDLDLFASDISSDALELLESRVSGVATFEADSNQLPFPDNKFDWVVSQFGVEYAGIDAFAEAFRVLAHKGQYCIVCHYADGYIDKKNQVLLLGAKAAEKSGFVDAALDLTNATYQSDTQRLSEARSEFKTSEQLLAKTFPSVREGIHLHLYFGFKQLYTNRTKYSEHDIVDWLTNMKTDIEKNLLRLTSMADAALDHSQIESIKNTLLEMGAKNVHIEPMSIPDKDEFGAWIIAANKPQLI